MSNDYQVLDQNLLNYATQEEKAAFYRKTYAHVAGAFLVFLALEVLLLSSSTLVELSLKMTQGWTWLIVLGLFMLGTTKAEKMAAQASVKMQYIGFGIYILLEALIFMPLLAIAIMMTGGTEVLTQAFIVTLALFGGLSAVVLITKKDFSFMRSALSIGGIIAIGLIVAGMLFGFNLGLWFSVGMVVLAAGSILYQTSNMVHKYESSQYVLAALGLFASFMLLLWYIIQIFLSRD